MNKYPTIKVEDVCPNCGEIRNGWELGYRNHHKVIWVACTDCGKERWVRYSVKLGKPRSLRCCSCGMKANLLAHIVKGGQNPYWKKDGRIERNGYVLIKLQPDDFFYPMVGKVGYVYEHRLVVAKALGRCLHRWELVHHKGTKYPKGSIENRSDNRYPENLQLVTDNRHKQITIMENRIGYLEKRVTLLEVENVLLKKERRVYD